MASDIHSDSVNCRGFPQGFPPFLASSVITLSLANCRLLDDKTVGLNRFRVFSRNSRKGEVT